MSHERNMEERRTSTPLESELLKVERRRREILTRVERCEGGDDETRSRVRIRNRNWRDIIHSCAAALIFLALVPFRIRDLNYKTMDNRDHHV